MKDNFETYLQDQHANEHPDILDDNMPDAFDDWVSNLDNDEWIRLANQFAYKDKRKVYLALTALSGDHICSLKCKICEAKSLLEKK